jgi:hypothetical protein
MCIKSMVLCTAIILSTASTVVAAGPNEGFVELRQCIAKMQASGRNFGGGDPDMGTTAYDGVVGRCMEQLYRERRQAR